MGARVVGLFLGSVTSRVAEAGEIPKIKLGDYGPDQRVHIVFVRYRYGPLGIAPRRTSKALQHKPNSCVEVRLTLEQEHMSPNVLREGGVRSIKTYSSSSPMAG